MSLLLSGGMVASSLDPPRVAPADVAVEGGRIAPVPAPGAARIDCAGCLVVPGNACGHTHLYSALARGMPFALEPPATFLQILQRVWWRLDRALDEESIRASALLGAMEALLAGTTSLVDHHASPNAVDGSLDVLAGALEEVGIRSVLCYEVTDRDGGERARAGVAENDRFLASLAARPRPLVRGMVGAHASFTLSEDTLAACVDVARRHDTGLHVHVAEDGADERDARARFGTTVAARLARAGALDDRALLAHCVHLDGDEIALVRDSAAAVAHNPRSNMHNGVGRAPVAALGPRVVLGTDGIGADMFEESRAGYFRLREDDLGAPAGWPLEWLGETQRMVGRGYAEPLLGRLEPGAPADLVVRDYDPPTPIAAENLAGHWTFGLSAGAVRDVIVGGEVVVRDRRPVRVDGAKVAAEAHAAAERLWARLERIDPHPFAPED